ncbi:secretin N-terminal domain-containing protein [Roseimaritima ulvae]|uniref:Bacterial type II/III secretion system short domain protein n=1 Tax=Roseimaritima ulvae TaxID=980254 RepID=A0A5B9QRY6_9BACT|nr:secretin N-terminal domain-containing protein [Roseimaritima ulvae]QEG41808.1 Bacterial type II/III secretion system short domain protein [Roseimaritima ulvae]
MHLFPLRRRRTASVRSAVCLALSLGLTSLATAQAPAPTAQAPATTAPAAEQATRPAAEADQPQSSPPAAEVEPTADQEPGLVRFSFNGAPWRDVVQWIADEAGMALHVGSLPPGSFTYADPDAFTYEQAIDRINLFLLAENYTLVRSGKLLSVIDLGDQRSVQQLEVLAKLVTADNLDQAEPHDVVKCIFPLGDIEAEEAVAELSALSLMTTPSILSRTNQLLITDTVAKLRSVKAILDAFRPSQMDNGTVVKSFALQHVHAEDVLLVARPHLGLATGEMIGIDVSLSSDLQGEHIYVTGIEDKVKLIEGLITAIDQPQASQSADEAGRLLRSHTVEGGNLETVYNVLQTLLAEKQVRLSMDPAAGTVVALASPEVHEEIAQTVDQLRAADAAFEVIPLKTIDPYFAIRLLEQMLDLPDPLEDPEPGDDVAPKIDADPDNMRLFVRAKQHQIEQIKTIIAGLELNGAVDGKQDMRILPMQGPQTVQLLETAAKFWRAAHPIVLYPSIADAGSQVTERVVNGEPQSASDITPPESTDAFPGSTAPPRWLTENASPQAPPIRCQLTPRGLLLQSDDAEALDRFEEHLRAIAGPVDALPSPPVVFYLKHTKPDDALRMLGELLDGSEAVKSNPGGSLVNGLSGSGGFLSSMVTSNEGTTTMMSGAITIVADSRLNRLIAQGTTADIEQIEGYLQIIDKDSSITSIETYGTTHVIELLNTRADDVAEAIREAYPGRIAGEDDLSKLSKNGDPKAAAAVAAALAQSKGQGKSAQDGLKLLGKTSNNQEPKLSVAVHEPSNSLIVTAPQQLFEEVDALVQRLDARGEQSVEVVSAMNSAAFEAVQQVLLGETPTSRSSSSRSSSRTSSTRGSTRSRSTGNR